MNMIKAHAFRIAFVGGILLLAGGSGALAQSYDINWWTVDAGGSQNLTGGNYTLSGTIGQPDACAPLSGGSYTLTGGFWAGYEEQPACYGDLDGDHLINLNDLAQLLGHYGQTGMTYEDGDLNEDGEIDLDDLAEMLSLYGRPCP
jgi:hypothetical protein